MQSLIITILHRPYVLAFLIAFLIIGLLNRGLVRTFLFLVIGYTIAFLSEFCSIRWGFPYGMYHYIYENMQGELILGGVPVWDSISYVFMAYASYEMAAFCPHPASGHPLPPRGEGKKDERVARGELFGTSSDADEKFSEVTGPARILVSSLLMTLLDIITDPLAVRGDQWFLGKIFYYPEGGIYFGVPLSNFAGWFLVGLIIFSLYTLAERVGAYGYTPLQNHPPLKKPILGPLFYLSIMLFNVVITFAIGEWVLGLIGAGILSLLVFFLAFHRRHNF